jgi:DNA-binding transcriptional MerR regulator
MNHNPLQDIHHYSPTLTIAQVLKFSERKALGVTRAMVQNYIRGGLLPPPDGRMYTHKHLAALVIIQRLKRVYDMPTIKAVLVPHLDGEGLPLDTYKRLMDILDDAVDKWKTHVAPAFEADMGSLSLMAHVAGLAELRITSS